MAMATNMEARFTLLEQTIQGFDQGIQVLLAELGTRLSNCEMNVTTRFANVENRMNTVESHAKEVATTIAQPVVDPNTGVTTYPQLDTLRDWSALLFGMNSADVQGITQVGMGVQGLQQQFMAHQAAMATMQGELNQVVTNAAVGPHTSTRTQGHNEDKFTKPIMDFRVWDDLSKLTSDRTRFRDWKMKFRSALRQCTRSKSVLRILDFVEKHNYFNRPGMNKEEITTIMADFYSDPTNQDVEMSDFERLSDEVEMVIRAKSEDKSEASVLMNRATNIMGEGKAGLLGWVKINAWYMQTSGMGISLRLGQVMNPPQSKSDEEVIHDVEKWLDDQRNLTSLGEDPLPPGYKITGIKRIATHKVREELEREERKLNLEGSSKDAIWEALHNYALNMSRDRMLEKQDKKGGPQPMDVGEVGHGMDMGGNTGYGFPDSQETWQTQGPLGYQGKGGKKGGKGYSSFGKSGKGKGKYGPPKGFGKKGKAPMGSYPTTPYYHNCKNCHRMGHSVTFCPDLGKGFTKSCDECGIIGHPKSVCPGKRYREGGKGGKGKLSNVNGGEMNLGGGEGEPQSEPQTDTPQKDDDCKYDENQTWEPQETWTDPFWAGTGVAGLDPWTQNIYSGKPRQDSQAQENEQQHDVWENYNYGVQGNLGWECHTLMHGDTAKAQEKPKEKAGSLCTIEKESKPEKGFKWVKLKAIVDSGAVETVTPSGTIGKGKLRETILSKRGAHYTAADGGIIKNLGEGDIEGTSEEGLGVKMTAQVGDKLSKTLISVRRIVEKGNMVIFGADEAALSMLSKMPRVDGHMIMHKKSGTISKVQEEGGLYVYPLWMKQKSEDEGLRIGAIDKIRTSRPDLSRRNGTSGTLFRGE